MPLNMRSVRFYHIETISLSNVSLISPLIQILFYPLIIFFNQVSILYTLFKTILSFVKNLTAITGNKSHNKYFLNFRNGNKNISII